MHSGLAGAEGVVLKQQIQELVNENEIFKDTVARLNVELSKFQEKYGVSPDFDDSKGFLSDVEQPSWLVSYSEQCNMLLFLFFVFSDLKSNYKYFSFLFY